jgi:hypothetical protein
MWERIPESNRRNKRLLDELRNNANIGEVKDTDAKDESGVLQARGRFSADP